MKLNYLIRGSKSICYRVTNGRNGIDSIRTLPIKLSNSDKWNKNKQSTTDNLNTNKVLIEFHQYIMNSYNDSILNHIDINKEWLSEIHTNYFKPQKKKKPNYTLLEYIEVYGDSNLSESTRKKLHTFKVNIASKHPKLKLKDIDLKFMSNLSDTLNSKGYAPASINKYLQMVKQILRFAYSNDEEIKHNTLAFKMLKTSTITHYINEEEINNLFKFKPSTKSLNNARKLFLIGGTTGLRVSDLMRIKSFNINNGMIELTTQKTKQNIVIPINPRVSKYIEDVRIISHPKFNSHLKDLFEEFGLNEITKGYIKGKNNKRVLGMYPKYKLISSHTMRRSFATNLYGKIPTMVIMAITGHSTEKSFLTYIKKPQRHFAEVLKNFYNN